METLEDFSMEKAIQAGTVDALELVESRAGRVVRVIGVVPNIMIRHELRMLREAIEWWEAEQKEI